MTASETTPRLQGLRRSAAVALLLGALVALGWSASDAWAGFGFVPGSASTVALNRDGTVDTQAGSHPYEYRVAFELNHVQNPLHASIVEAEGYMRDLEVDLPPGLVGNPGAVPRCSRHDYEGLFTKCPGDTEIGTIQVFVAGAPETLIPVYDLVPPPGVPASFGFSAASLNGIEEASVRTGAGYGVRIGVDNSPAPVIRAEETIWGVPPEASHDHERTCIYEANGRIEETKGGCSSQVASRPFLTLPTSCTGPLVTTLRAVSLQGEEALAQAVSRNDAGEPAGLTGCAQLPFEPLLSLLPQTQQGEPDQQAESPAGLTTELTIPQPETPAGLAESDIKEALVRLPEGVTISPSAAADGLGACPLAGPEGINLTTPERAHCPDASKLGTVEVQTPLLEHPLKGSVFLAQQGDLLGNGENPFGSLLAIYLSLEGEGVFAKIPGKIELDETTGEVTARFGGVKDTVTGEEYLPQLPYSRLRMSFFGGPQAPLILPAQCGTYTTTSRLTAWSSTPEHLLIAEPSSQFTIDQGCTHPFTPSFTAGTTSPQAGGYSPFVTAFARQDGEQRLNGFEETLPAGLLANLASVPPCSDEQASAAECPESSRIGSVTVHAGPGPDPLSVNGNIYLTGPYDDGPFGEIVEVPAIAGPFNLDRDNGSRPITVRGSIRVNPQTAQATVVSDPLPQFILGTGVPTDVREVQVTLDRPNFTLNPTNCNPLSITAQLTSTTGASAPVSAPFHARGCAGMPFHPTLEAFTQGQASKADGASLTVKLTSQGLGQANIAKVFLTIPRILPARLQPTLQHACPQATFNANPAGCDEDSLIGTATVHTPILKSPLTGPAYLVSHGNAAFPDVEFVLQGEGITLILDGKTDIKAGVTYSRFESAPDAPFTSFETSLPTGPHSVFAVNTEEAPDYNLCAHNLTIPTRITGQNGAVIEQDTKLVTTGCSGVLPAKAKLTRAQLLAKALKACRRHKQKAKRVACERAARKRYAPTSSKKHPRRARNGAHRHPAIHASTRGRS